MRTFGALLAAGGRALARHRELVLALYAVQLVVSVVVGGVVATALVAPLSRHPIFDDAVDGDLFALLAVLGEHADLLVGLAWVAIALALLWGALSWFLTGGLLAVLAAPTGSPRARGASARTFGAGGAVLMFAFGRLWLWSLIPYAAIVALAIVGLRPAFGAALDALTIGELARVTVVGALPAALLWMCTRAVLDFARVELTMNPQLGSGRALLRALGFVRRRPLALAHLAAYCALWLAIAIGYVAVTWERPLLGAGGAVALFALRQVSLVARYALHVGLLAGQLHLRRQ